MRKVLVWFLGYCMVILLLVTANTTIFSRVTSNPERVKQIIVDSGAYEASAPFIIEELLTRGVLESGPFSLQKDSTQQLAQQVFDGKRVQAVVEPVIDGIYAWLNGQTSTPKFAVNLNSTRDALASDLAKYQVDRITKLPACKTDSAVINTNVLSLQCKPTTKLDETAIKQAIDNYLKQEGGLLNESLTPQAINMAQGQTALEKIQSAPKSFQTAKKLPWIFGILALLSAVGIVFIANTRSYGLKCLGVTLVVAGIVLAALPSVNNLIIGETLSRISSSNIPAYKILEKLLPTVNNSTAYIYYVYSGVVILLSTLTLGFRHYYFRDDSK